jgi:two-component system cell cycle response regulator
MGGEEFLVVCQPGNILNVKSSGPLCRKTPSAYQASNRSTSAKLHIQISISIGIAFKEAGMQSEDHLVNAANKALYAAKNAGTK